MGRQETFQRVDATNALEIALRNTRYETLEELVAASRAEILRWMQKHFPRDDIRDLSRLRGPLVDFADVVHQDEVCALCKEKGRYRKCPTSGRICEVLPIPNTIPRQFSVSYRECGWRRTALQDSEKKREPAKTAAAAPKGFAFDLGETGRRDIDA